METDLLIPLAQRSKSMQEDQLIPIAERTAQMHDELLIRIDERTQKTAGEVTEIKTRLTSINGSIVTNCSDILQLKNKAKDNRTLILGMWGLLIAFITGFGTFVLKKLGLA